MNIDEQNRNMVQLELKNIFRLEKILSFLRKIRIEKTIQNISILGGPQNADVLGGPHVKVATIRKREQLLQEQKNGILIALKKHVLAKYIINNISVYDHTAPHFGYYKNFLMTDLI